VPAAAVTLMRLALTYKERKGFVGFIKKNDIVNSRKMEGIVID